MKVIDQGNVKFLEREKSSWDVVFGFFFVVNMLKLWYHSEPFQ